MNPSPKSAEKRTGFVLPTSRRYVWMRWSVISTTLGVAFQVSAYLWPHPLNIVFSLTLGALLGLLALGLFIASVALDLRHHEVM